MMNQFAIRRYIIIALFLFIGFVFAIRLFYLQIIDEESKLDAKNQALRYVTDYAPRGYIFDRKGRLLVYNEAAYDLMVTPRQVKDIDTMSLCRLLGIEKEGFIKRMKSAKQFSRYKSSVFEKQISAQTYAALQEMMHKFHGFYVQQRTLRKYPRNTAAHLLGYIGEISKNMAEKNPYYKEGDYIGISGIERAYEEELRGKKGVRIVMVDVFNREKGNYKNGMYDTMAVAGKNVVSTIDAELQMYGEALMQNKLGSIVAIEPSTGDILAMVTSPTYDPNLMVGRARSKNYSQLSKDPLKPLYNRAAMASYPPGSTFKPLNGLIGMQEGTLLSETHYSCNRGYSYGGPKPVGCHPHPSPVDFMYSIQTSCNSYYCQVFRAIIDNKRYNSVRDAYVKWRQYVMSFGYGKRVSIDLPNELNGNVPSPEFYDRYHGKGRWKSATIISLGIGQGELGVTPVQLANFVATVANRGYFYSPRTVKYIDGKPINDPKYKEKHKTMVSKENFLLLVEAMYQVVENGTGRGGKIDGIPYCGKTGTAQNPHGEDHSIYMAFAPKDNPKIAMAVYVENAGFGATWAVPITSLMIEKYLRDSISRPDVEKHIMEAMILPKEYMGENVE